MDIEGLGYKLVDQLLEKKMLHDYSSIYDLKFDELVELDRFGKKSAENLLEGIENSKKRSFDQQIFALGIRFVGETVAKLLADSFSSIDDLAAASPEQLTMIDGIGGRIAESIAEFFSIKQNLDLIEKLKKRGLFVVQPRKKKAENAKLSGQTFVITGTLDAFSRDQAKDAIEELGGKVTSSVSKNTDYLICGENPGSKLDNAKKHGVKILDEDEFKKLIK
jgi:DNA ligase (NAD+)